MFLHNMLEAKAFDFQALRTSKPIENTKAIHHSQHTKKPSKLYIS